MSDVRGSGFGPGFLGKMPAVGDFVRHGLPRAVADPWDGLLTDVVDLGLRRHGRDWGGVLAAGAWWRFALEPGACGGHAAAGLLVPSLDRVGRPYPLLVAASLPDGTDAALAPFACDAWFTGLERLTAGLLAGACGYEGYAAGLASLGRPVPEGGIAAALCRRAIEERTGALPAPASLWWSLGQDRAASAFAACAGLPPADRLASMLDGGWRAWTGGHDRPQGGHP